MMETTAQLQDIAIRTYLEPGDMGFVIHMHGKLYSMEYGYGLSFESYVANGFYEFITNYKPERDGVWVCEHHGKMIGFLLLMDRGNDSAQLRFFILNPHYRGIGLGRKLMAEFLNHMETKKYRHAYLWTTHEQEAAAYLYTKAGFKLTEQKNSSSFGKPLIEQRYDLFI